MSKIELCYMIFNHLDVMFLTLLTALCFNYFIKPFLKNSRYTWMIGAVYFFVMIFFFYMPWYIDNFYAYGIGIIYAFGMMCLIDRWNIKQKLFLSITFFSLRWLGMALANYAAKAVYYVIYERITHPMSQMTWFMIDMVIRIAAVALGVGILACSIYLIRKAYVYKRAAMEKKEMLMLIVPSISGVIGYGILRMYEDVYIRDTGKDLFGQVEMYDWFCFFYYIISITAILVMVIAFQHIKGRQEEARQNQLLNSQLRDMEKHIGEMDRLYKDIKGLKHDMGNHISILEKLCMNDEFEEAKSYLQELKERMNTASGEIKTGNPVTDVILNEIRKKTEEKGILFECSFHFPKDSGMNVFDISVIVNNALLNAVEAAEKSEKPYLYICSYLEKNAYMIEVKNTYAEPIRMDEETGLPASSKKEEKEHGYGLQNIRKAAQKYHGEIEIEYDPVYFILSIMLMTK